MIILVFTYASDRSNQSDQGALDLRDVCFEAIIGAKNLKKQDKVNNADSA